MSITRAGFLAALATTLCAGSATAQAPTEPFPSRPIRIISPFGAGGPNDLFSRQMAEHLARRLGQPVIVENRSGADGRIGADFVAKAPADGHTLLMLSLGHTAHPALFRLTYDVERDFLPISRVASVPLILVVPVALPVNSTAEFIALARAQPGRINYASGGNGTSQHLAMALFNAATGTSMQHVPYRGLPPALTDMLNGQIQAMMSPIAFALPHVRAGRLRVLGVTTAERSGLLPEVPTIAEAGLPGFVADTWHGLVAPAGTPREIVERLNAEVVAILAQPELREGFAAIGAVPSGNSTAQFAAEIRSDIEKWGRLVRTAGITAE